MENKTDIWYRIELPENISASQKDKFYKDRADRLLTVGNVFYCPVIHRGGVCEIEEYILINKSCDLDEKLLLVVCEKERRDKTELIHWHQIIHNYRLGCLFINKFDAETILKEELNAKLSALTNGDKPK